MPANLNPDYYRAELEYRKAASPHERFEALKKMMAVIPKHKGTEKMRGDLKKRMAMVREEIQKTSRKKGYSVNVEREGGSQVTLAGPPNSGKSQLAASLTKTKLDVAPYPYTTRMPHPVMMPFEDIQIQLVDLPPVCSQHMECWVPSIIRNCDLVLIVFDLVDPEAFLKIEDTLTLLEINKIQLVNYTPKQEFWESTIMKRGWLVGCKRDMPEAEENWDIIKEEYFNKLGLSAVSACTGNNLELLRTEIFNALDILRIYSKPPGKEAVFNEPFVLKKGETLMDFAQIVHKDFAEHLKFARLWGHGKFQGQRINRDYILQDKDIIELHL